MRIWLAAAVVLAMGVTVLLGTTANLTACRVAAAVLLLVWMVLKFPLMGRTERLFLVGAAASTLAAFAAPSPAATIQTALERAALFLVFVFALGFLREAARTSRAVAHCGRYIVARPPGWRYAALTVGGHVFSIVLNIGALSLLGSMVSRSDAKSADTSGRLDRQRRMGSALFRGFTTIVLWSPVGAGVPITLSLLPNVSWLELAPRGLALCATFLSIGWILDRLTQPATTLGSPAPSKEQSFTCVFPMLAITALILVAVVGTDATLGVDLFVAVVGVTPLAGLCWIMAQYWRAGAQVAVVGSVRRAIGYLRDQMPSLRPDGMIVVALAYISVVIGTLAQATPFGDLFGQWQTVPIAVALAIPVLMALLGQIGVNPLVSAILMCATLGSLDPMPLPPLVLAVMVQGGWSIALATTPYSGSGLILARALGTSAHALARWNMAYGISCYAALAIYAVAALVGAEGLER